MNSKKHILRKKRSKKQSINSYFLLLTSYFLLIPYPLCTRPWFIRFHRGPEIQTEE